MRDEAPSNGLTDGDASGRSASGGRLNPAALPVADAARLLSRLAGRPVTDAMLRADIDGGAPTNADGTINVVHYAAWLVKEMAASGGVRAD